MVFQIFISIISRIVWKRSILWQKTNYLKLEFRETQILVNKRRKCLDKELAETSSWYY